jgi:cytochrome P450
MNTACLPPGPHCNWPLGQLLEFRRDNLAFYTNCARRYGDVVSYRLGPHRVYQVNHPDLIEQVLVHPQRCFNKNFFALRHLQPILGNGLLTSESDFWLRQRRLAQPAFQRERIADYANIIVSYAERLRAHWRHGETRDLHVDMMRLTLEIAAKTLFDADVARDAAEVGAAFEVVQTIFSRRFQSLLPLPLWIPTPGNLRMRRAIRRLDQIVFQVIQQRRRSGEDRNDVLSRLLRAQDVGDDSCMTDRQLRDEIMTLFLAGHETTALALTWTWYLLAQHPEADAKLTKELDTVLQGRLPTLEDLPQLNYTERIILESMRLYPPAYGIGREACAECELGGYHVPVKTAVFLVQWVVHRDARYFDHPDVFDPDRWQNDLAQRLPRYAYFPFGGGGRVCLGANFAMMEAVLALATLAQKFRATLVPGHEVTPIPCITLRPANGMMMSLTRRA